MKRAKYSSLGGYPLFFLPLGGGCLCSECASEREEVGIVAEVNWENISLYCDKCSIRIESAADE